jgi:hypothetical protein
LREEGMNMVEEQYHPMNHRLEVEDMDMVGIHMVEEHYHLMNHRPEVGGIDREDMTVTFLPLKRMVSPN